VSALDELERLGLLPNQVEEFIGWPPSPENPGACFAKQLAMLSLESLAALALGLHGKVEEGRREMDKWKDLGNWTVADLHRSGYSVRLITPEDAAHAPKGEEE
jgi:hypothetical protein